MKKLSVYLVVIALVLGSAATVQHAMHHTAPLNLDNNAFMESKSNAAFRDGLYLGKRAALNGEQHHIASGRWATDWERSAFREGYQRGFSQTLVSRARALH